MAKFYAGSLEDKLYMRRFAVPPTKLLCKPYAVQIISVFCVTSPHCALVATTFVVIIILATP